MMDSGSVLYGEEQIAYEVHYSGSRRTLAIEVHPDLRVVVKAPADCASETIQAKVLRRVAWIDRQRERFRGFQRAPSDRRYVSGETHLYLGRQYRLKAVHAKSTVVKLAPGRMIVGVPLPASPEQVRDALHRWYLTRSREIFGPIIEQCVRRLYGQRAASPRLIVRSMRSRWGSMSEAGSMTLNLRLLRAPKACIEYVVVHELCHLRYRNHGPGFYSALDKAMPEWRIRKAKLEMVAA
jgi:predicted metal-dependent hydrolase